MKKVIPMLHKIPVGEYEMFIVEKGMNECVLDGRRLRNGEAFFTVRTEDNLFTDYKHQSEADVVARLVRIEKLLKKLMKRQ